MPIQYLISALGGYVLRVESARGGGAAGCAFRIGDVGDETVGRDGCDQGNEPDGDLVMLEDGPYGDDGDGLELSGFGATAAGSPAP